MTLQRGAVLPMLTLSAVASATTWIALFGWRGFVEQPYRYLLPLAVVAAVVAGLGTLLRSAGAPRSVTLLAQVMVTTGVVSWQITGSALPTGSTASEIGAALRASVETARDYAAPIGQGAPPLWPLLLVVGACFLVLVDTIAVTFDKVPASGIVLLAVYSVPSGLLEDGPDPLSFAGSAIGFLVLLHLDARAHLLRWGRPIGPGESSAWRSGSAVGDALRAGAGRIGLVAVLLALALAPLVPVLGSSLIDVGTGDGSGDIRIRKPVADLRRDLERGQDVPLVWVRTDDPDPSYLRISVLNRYTGNEWSSGNRDVASNDVADGEIPRPSGLSPDVPTTTYDYSVEIDQSLDSTWLPTQFPAAAVTAEGDWRFDPTTMDFLAADRGLDTRGLGYTMTALEPSYGTTGEFFRDSQAATVPGEVLSLPSGVPEIARELAESVTAPADTDYERALLLQRWFRIDGGFEYSLDEAPRGQGNGTLERFLSRDGRVGYCEQYASAMAVMARVLGIPARVAVGFLEPEPLGNGNWVYSSHDLHAWPELYFAGAGWVRFEPTPAGRVETVPPYSRVDVGEVGEDPTALPSGRSGDAATSSAPAPAPTRAPVPEEGVSDGDGESESLSAWLVGGLAVLVVLALAALVVGLPLAWRGRARRTRLGGGAEEIWQELRSRAVDLGLPWRDDHSPRQVSAALRAHLADPSAAPTERPATGPTAAPDADAALERLLVSVERTRYGRPGTTAVLDRPTDLRADAELVLASLEAGVTRGARRRARWLPRSVWRRGS